MLDNCFRDFVSKVIAMIGVARRTSFVAIAQETTLNQHCGITALRRTRKFATCTPRFIASGRVSSLLWMRWREVVRRRRMIIGLESVNPAPAGIVEMNADEDGVLL